MLTRLIAFAVYRAPLVLLGSVGFAWLGWQCLANLPIEAFPDVTDPMVEIVGLYPGQAAEEVEQKLAVELERVLAGTPHMVDLRSVSVFGLTLLTLKFSDDSSAMSRRTHVAERLREANLPAGASVSLGPEATPVGQIYRYTLSGPQSLRELRALADFVVERRLRAVAGVADVVTFGGFEREYHVQVDAARLAAAGVSLDTLYQAIASSNVNAGGGYVQVGSQELVLHSQGVLHNAAELGLAVLPRDGAADSPRPLRVQDVATIVDGVRPRRGAVGRGTQDEVIEGIVLLRHGANPSVVLAAVKQRVAELNEHILPPGVSLVPFYDRSQLVAATLKTVRHNMLEGIALVLLLTYLFLNTWRAVCVVAWVIPLALFSAFMGLRCLGLPANLISLGAIDFGILVDGGILVVEAILHALHHAPRPSTRPWTPQKHIQHAVGQVAAPVAFAMLMIMVALGPIFNLQHVEGRMFAPMAYTYAFALLGALLGALLVVPSLAVVLLGGRLPPPPPRWLRTWVHAYGCGLARLQPQRWRLAAGVMLCSVALAALSSRVGSEFLPELNEGGLYITAVLPATIALAETQQQVRLMRQSILQTPEVADVLSHIGRPEAATQAEGPNNAEFFVVLRDASTWRRGMSQGALEAEIRTQLQDIPGVEYNFSQPITDRVYETLSGIIGQVVVKIHGSDLATMRQTAEGWRQQLAHINGITDLALYQAGVVPALQITLDRQALAQRGLRVEAVQTTLAQALGGSVATQFWQQDYRFGVSLQLDASLRSDAASLARLPLGEPAMHISLGDVADIRLGSGPAAIWREDFNRFVALKFNVRGRDLGSTVEAAQRQIAASVAQHPLPVGHYLSWGGAFQNQQRALRRLAVSLPLCLLVFVGLLYGHLRSMHATALVLSFLPIAVVGALGGLWVCGERFSVSSAVGCIALFGQVVLVGITFYARLDAVTERLQGAQAALRPVLLTTSLALLGLLPAASSQAMGSETQRPFAIAIVAGLLWVTPAMVCLLPLFYRPRAVPQASALPSTTAWTPALMLFGLLWCQPLHAHVAAEPHAAATTAPSFTLQAALQLLQRSHPRLLQAQALLEAAQHASHQAGKWGNPTLAGDYLQDLQARAYDAGGIRLLSLSQTVPLRRLPYWRQSAAQHHATAAQAQLQALQRRLQLTVEQRYSALLEQAQRQALQASELQTLMQAAQWVNKAVEVGSLAPFAARRVRLAVAMAQTELHSMQALYAQQRDAFDNAVGPLAATLQGQPLPYLIETADAELCVMAAQQRPDIRAVQASHAGAQANVEIAQRQVWPALALRFLGGYGQSHAQWDVGAGFSLELPLLNQYQDAVLAAYSRQQAIQVQLQALQRSLPQRLANATEVLQQRRTAQATFQQQTAQTAEHLGREATALLQAGRLSIVEWVDAINTEQHLASQALALASAVTRATLQLRLLCEVGDPFSLSGDDNDDDVAG